MRTVDELRTALDYRDAPATPPAGALIARAHRRRVVRRRTLLAAGTAAVAAPAVALGLAPVRGGGARPAAAQVLDRAAGVAAASWEASAAGAEAPPSVDADVPGAAAAPPAPSRESPRPLVRAP